MANKLNWLDEVRQDAIFNFMRRKREQEEKAAYEASKKKIKQPSEVAEQAQKKGK